MLSILYTVCTIQVFSHMKSTTIKNLTFSFCKHYFNIQIISKWYQILILIPNPSTNNYSKSSRKLINITKTLYYVLERTVNFKLYNTT